MIKLGSERSLGYRALVVIFALVGALLAYAFMANRANFAPELAASDALSRTAPRAARPDVAIVALDNASVQRYGAVKSWNRSVLAQGLARIDDAGAKVVVMDLALDKREESAGDAQLWRAMANHKNVVLGMAYDAARSPTYTPDDIRGLVFLEKFAIADNLTLALSKTQQFPYYDFEPPVSDFTGSAAGVGVFDRETDSDGVLRDARLFYISTVQYPPSSSKIPGHFPQSNLADGAPVALPNIALAAALNVFNLQKTNITVISGDTVALSGHISPPVNIPIDTQGRMWIRYANPARGPQIYSFTDIATGKVKPDFKNKIVLIGATATGDPATDLSATPFGNQPRVVVTANALSTILDRDYVGVVNRYPHQLLGTLLLLGLITGLCLMLVSEIRAIIAAIILLIVYLAVCWGLYSAGHLLLPILPGIFVIVFAYLVSLILSLGPFRPITAEPSPTYVPPPDSAIL